MLGGCKLVTHELLTFGQRASRRLAGGIKESNTPIYSVVLQGGLGNRLFQIASIYGLSRLHRTRFLVAPEYVFGNSHSEQSYERYYQQFLAEEVYQFEKYCEAPFRVLSHSEIPRQEVNTLFEGFFQNEKYFLSLRKEILRLFGPTHTEREVVHSRHGNLKRTAFIHVRMGDYIGNSLHEVDLLDYFRYCLQDIRQRFQNAHILVSTDDQERCLERLPFLSSYDFLQEQNEILALYTLASCGLGGVCSNSSFSWWGAWLNTSRRKRVYLPSRWFNDLRFEQKNISMKKSTVVDVVDINQFTGLSCNDSPGSRCDFEI